eukprot:37788-Rhodomonas_salina.2
MVTVVRSGGSQDSNRVVTRRPCTSLKGPPATSRSAPEICLLKDHSRWCLLRSAARGGDGGTEELDQASGQLEAAEGTRNAGKKELKSAEGKLKTAEGKLEATKEELRTAKEELRTVKGKLEAAEGKLEAAEGTPAPSTPPALQQAAQIPQPQSPLI